MRGEIRDFTQFVGVRCWYPLLQRPPLLGSKCHFLGHNTASGDYRPEYLDLFDKKNVGQVNNVDKEKKAAAATSATTSTKVNDAKLPVVVENEATATDYQKQFQQVGVKYVEWNWWLLGESAGVFLRNVQT